MCDACVLVRRSILSAQLQTPNRGDIARIMAAPQGAPPVEWRIAEGLTPYEDAVAFMEARAEAIAAGEAPELVWLVEHPPLYTAGTSAHDEDLVDARFPVHRTG